MRHQYIKHGIALKFILPFLLSTLIAMTLFALSFKDIIILLNALSPLDSTSESHFSLASRLQSLSIEMRDNHQQHIYIMASDPYENQVYLLI